jgi:hypothetical protein
LTIRYPLVECPNCHKPVDVNGYWQVRAFAAEREIERLAEHLDSANEMIARLVRVRNHLKDLDPVTGWPH